MEKDGIHLLTQGASVTVEQLDEMSEEYQNQIRHSPLWDEMVHRFSQKKAETLLKEFRAELR